MELRDEEGEGFLSRALRMLENERFFQELGINWQDCLARFGTEDAVYTAFANYVRAAAPLLKKMLRFRAENASFSQVSDYGITAHLVMDESSLISCATIAEAAGTLYKLAKNTAKETLIYASEHSETAEYIPMFPQSVLTLIDKPATSEQVKGLSVGIAGSQNPTFRDLHRVNQRNPREAPPIPGMLQILEEKNYKFLKAVCGFIKHLALRTAEYSKTVCNKEAVL